MFGIGFWEFVIIFVVVLLFLGPDKIGPIARLIGKTMREMQRSYLEVKKALRIDEEIEEVEEIKREVIGETIEEIKKEQKELMAETTSSRGEDKTGGERWDRLHEEAGTGSDTGSNNTDQSNAGRGQKAKP